MDGNGGRPEEYCRRLITDAIFYITDNGCKWRNLPCDFPPFLWNQTCQAASKVTLVDLRWPAGSKAGRLLCCEHGDLWFRAVLPDRGRRDSPGARLAPGCARR
ncbi:transposase [Streptomyces sp. NPDC060334]|uniref:transposase n=1 Tax=unclassified Streptomyces TaxID=2593676 RepID=UPI00364CB199